MSEQNRELDREIAEKLMELRFYCSKTADFYGLEGNQCCPLCDRPVLPHYSKYIGDAWMVVEAMRRKKYCMELKLLYGSSGYSCEFTEPSSEYRGFADTAPMAICLAALKAMGEEDV